MDDQEFGEMLQMVKDTRDDVKEIKKDVKAQNGRVRRLEIKWGYMAGIGSILLFGIPLILKYVF